MKKILALIMGVSFATMAFAGCSEKKDEPNATTPSTDSVKTGLGVLTSTASSKAAGTEDGLGAIYSTVAAVTLDKDGKIADVIIDVLQTKIAFSAEGKITTPIETAFKTKKELGDDYGMKPASEIGKEWFEQVAALEKYFIGKTAEEIKGIALEEKKPTDKDLASSVTIKIVDYIDAVVKACENAKDLGASSSDKLKLSLTTDIFDSKDYFDADGVAASATNFIALTLDSKNVITSSVIDVTQGKVTFDNTGAITSDITAPVMSKADLGDDYGMKAISPIGKEWYEQAEAFSKYITGKTAADVTGIALVEGKATDSDLASSVTIAISSFIELVEKACK